MSTLRKSWRPSAAVIALSIASLLTANSAFAAIQLKSDLSIFVEKTEPESVQRAAVDLASDFKKVLGKQAKIIHNLKDGGSAVIAIGRTEGAVESFSITTEDKSIDGHKLELVNLRGADPRGTIFAIYQFSEDYLGIDPMYYWTDKKPKQRAEISIPDNLARKFDSPVFRYRGFFINDEDLLTMWAPGKKSEHTGISLEVWDHIFETLLRLKANMVVAGSWPFAGEPQQLLAGKRGLALSLHHATPLGVNMMRWPKGVPYNYTTHPEILEKAWTDAVKAFPKNQEVLWQLGLRGLSDESYASLDPAVRDSEQAAGALISKALAKQVSIVKAEHPNATFITNLWQEGATLMRKGYLQIPDADVITVWADDGWGWLQDHGQAKTGQGAYYHVAMHQREANQLTEMVPVDRIFSEFGRYEAAGATNFLLVNASDIRPVAMTAKATMDFAWKGSKGVGSSKQYYRQWAEEQFGPVVASEMPDLFKAYFDAPAKTDRIRTEGDRPASGWEYGEQKYHYVARNYLLTAMIKRPIYFMSGQSPLWRPLSVLTGEANPQWVDRNLPLDLANCEGAVGRWDQVWKKALALQSKVDPSRRDFYQASVLTMIEINRESNAMLLSVVKARQAIEKNDQAAALKHLASAREAIGRIKTAEEKAEYGKWKHWYQGDLLTGVDRTLELIDRTSNWLKDPRALLPIGVSWNVWDAYNRITEYQGYEEVNLK